MPTATRIYALLLIVYPEPFRARFGREMIEVFENCRAAMGARVWTAVAPELAAAIWERRVLPHLRPIPLVAIIAAALIYAPLLWLVEPGLQCVKAGNAAGSVNR